MTMGRGERKSHQIEIRVARETDGITLARFAKTGRQMSESDYREHRMGRRSRDQETARCQKLEKAGWTYVEGSGTYRKMTRRG